MKNKFYLKEFQIYDGEATITFNIVDINEIKEEILVAISNRGGISLVTYDLLKDKNDYFISDLIGLNVYMDDEFFGEIIDVLTANVDIFKIQVNDGKIAYIPFLKALLIKVDLQENKILLKKEIQYPSCVATRSQLND